MTKKTAACTLGILAVAMVFANLLLTPNIGWFLNQDLSTWMNIGQTVGTALAHAFGSSWFELIGIIAFIA